MSELLSDNIKETWKRWWEIVNELTSHTLAVCFMLGCIAAIDWFAKLVHGQQEIIFFDHSSFKVRLRDLLDIADISIIIFICGVAVYSIGKGVLRK